MDYSHLSDIPAVLPPAPRFQRLRRLLFDNPLARVVASQHAGLKEIDALAEKTRRSIGKANADIGEDQAFESGFGYEDDIREVAVALAYKKQIDEGFPGKSDSKLLYQHVDQVLSERIANSKVSRVLNFGVSYAYCDAVLAAKFPNVTFTGTDRSTLTKALNEQCFGHLRNMEFIAGDIFEHLKTHDLRDTLLWTMRTGLLLPKPFLARLYAAAAAAGVTQVTLIEPIGLSRETMKPYRFSDDDQPSVALREGMFIHNYPGILKRAGFTVERAELIRMDHPHPDVKILSITAKRTGS